MSAPLAGLRIGLVTASASRLGGGVFEAVAAQAALIRRLGGEAPVFALADRFSADDAHRFSGSELVHCPSFRPAQFGFAPQLLSQLLAARLDCLHLHGIWTYPTRAATQWALTTKRRFVVSPHGMFDPWLMARGKWKKALARIGYVRACCRRADVLHALTGGEAAEIGHEAGRFDALIVPNPAPECGGAPQPGRAPIVAFIGRIHPKKNVLALIEGWKQARLHPQAQLQIAGWGDPGDVCRLEAAVAAAGPEVRFLGPVFGTAKEQLLARARFAILPSFGEGLPMAVLDGWAAGTPAILTANCNLPEGFAAGAALECSHSPGAIAEALEAALALDDAAWLDMARAAQGLARGPFSGATVAARWAEAYRGEALSVSVRA
jgi:glycosyltransferase involved in cell wall biosynthesis